MVRHYRVTAIAGTGATLQDAADALDNAIGPFIRPLMSLLAVYQGVDVARISPGFRSLAYRGSLLAGGGAVGGDLLPTGVSGIITLRTAFAGRAFRGRVYIPFPSETDNQDGVGPTAAYTANAQGLAAQLVLPFLVGTAPNTASISPVIYHRETNTFTPITGSLVRDYWANQRRRSPTGRPNLL